MHVKTSISLLAQRQHFLYHVTSVRFLDGCFNSVFRVRKNTTGQWCSTRLTGDLHFVLYFSNHSLFKILHCFQLLSLALVALVVTRIGVVFLLASIWGTSTSCTTIFSIAATLFALWSFSWNLTAAPTCTPLFIATKKPSTAFTTRMIKIFIHARLYKYSI